METGDLKTLLDRAKNWPETAQEELVQLGREIEGELQSGGYQATRDELRVIDEAIASVDRGEIASAEAVQTAFAKFRPA